MQRQLNVLLLSGLGPVWPASSSFYDSNSLVGTMFDRKSHAPPYHSGLGRNLAMHDFYYVNGNERVPLIRPRLESEPHLTTEALCSIIASAGRSCELFRLEDVWDGLLSPATAPDVVALSTTYIVNMRAMRAAIAWIESRYPEAVLIVGGQYSNLKYARLMKTFPQIDYIVRGDAELALPMLLDALEGRQEIDRIPNIVSADGNGPDRTVRISPVAYIDLDVHPSPRFSGAKAIVPYESMRGCPFTCKFCSFPAASPLWRYKSAEKICRDWAGYAEINDAGLIRAMDSTFTVPPARFSKLLEDLPALGVSWEAYTRANVISSPAVVDGLARAHCTTLSIGFESMSDASLKYMNKAVHSSHNRRAHELLVDSPVDFRSSFIIGYPGETPEDYALTHDFLVDEFQRHIVLSVFSLTDETMPVWNDAERFKIEVGDFDDPDADWRHIGMDVQTARELHQKTFRDIRWKNDRAVSILWQLPYQLPLMPERSLADNYRVEKLLERLAFAPRDFADAAHRVETISRAIVDELETLEVFVAGETSENRRALLNPLAPPIPRASAGTPS